MPLLLSGQPIGFLDIGHRQTCHYRAEDLAFLSAPGQEVAIAVRNAPLYQAEKRQVEQLQALERLQSNFVYSVSHELRTPLTILRTSLALLREQGETGPLSPLGNYRGRQGRGVRRSSWPLDCLPAGAAVGTWCGGANRRAASGPFWPLESAGLGWAESCPVPAGDGWTSTSSVQLFWPSRWP